MHYTLISIFPELFQSFVETSLVEKAISNGLLGFSFVNPRDFCHDKHRQVDDEMYGGGVGLLMKAPPLLDALRFVLQQYSSVSTAIIMPSPAPQYFDQLVAHSLAERYEHIVFLCGRYEGIDHRVELWCKEHYKDDFYKLSLGKFVTLGGEVPSMVMIEAISRLLPGVIKEATSRQEESYRPEFGGDNIEHPQYTRPEEVEGMRVPAVLLSGHHAQIDRRKKHSSSSSL